MLMPQVRQAVGSSGKGSNKVAGYVLPPENALAYLAASGDALSRAAENAHVGHSTRAFVEMQGLENVPIYVAKALRPTQQVGHPHNPVRLLAG